MGLINASFSSNPHTLETNLAAANAELSGASAAQVIRWALARADNPVMATNFRPRSVALLHMLVSARADLPVIWVDSGYNTPATYRYVDALTRRWQLNVHVYSPRVTSARRQALHGALPAAADLGYTHFVRDSKLEPFERAFNELKPDLWFTGIRRDQTELRQTLGVVSRGLHNTLRVAPLYDWNAAQLAAYINTHDLPDNDDYVDPTKPGQHQECGLQLLA